MVRLWEVDSLRGVAIIMMVIYHLMWDLASFGIAEVDLYGPFWRTFQRITASLFLALVGVSLQLRAGRMRATDQPAVAVWRRQLRRGLTVFGAGLLVTAVTWLVIPSGVVVFGILHLIGFAIVAAYPFTRWGRWNVLLGLAVIAAARPFETVTVDYPWLVWLGLRPHQFASVDYFPVLPWFGVVLIGLALGQLAYSDPARRWRPPDLSRLLLARLLGFLGRHSLLIYLIHQPILIAILLALGLLHLDALR